MAIYIVYPKKPSVVQSLDLMSRSFSPEDREKQLDEVLSIRNESPGQRDIYEWTTDAQRRESIRVLKGDVNSGVTGMTVVDLPDEEFERMRRDLPEVNIVPDRSIELVRPQASKKRDGKTLRTEELKHEHLWHLDAIGGKDQFLEFRGKGVTIAVLDTGIQSSHSAFKNKRRDSYEFYDSEWHYRLARTSKDTAGHGTHVAGLICGNKIGVAQDASLIGYTVLPRGKGTLSGLIRALEYVGRQPEVSIVNISAGFQKHDRDSNSEIAVALSDLLAVGVLSVCAVGNDGRNRSRSPGNCLEALSVGATDRNNKVAHFSASGEFEHPNGHRYSVPCLVAPGKEVYSSVMTGGYEAWEGTSMAAPIVAGVAAVLLSKDKNLAVTDLQGEILERCVALEKQESQRQGAGLVQMRI